MCGVGVPYEPVGNTGVHTRAEHALPPHETRTATLTPQSQSGRLSAMANGSGWGTTLKRTLGHHDAQ